MDKTDISDKVEYVIAAISEFGKRHGLSHVEAYRYLKRFQGMDMLDKFYDVMHTLSFKDITNCFLSSPRRGIGMKLYHGSTVEIKEIDIAKYVLPY